MGAFFGLLAALLWGIADLLARFSGQAIGPWRTLFYGEAIGFVLLTAWLAASRDPSQALLAVSASSWLLGVMGGAIALAGAYAMTKALTVGTISLVMPIATSYGAISALLAIAGGEPITTLALAGIAMTIIGVALAGAAPAQAPGSATRDGIGWALLAAIGYGVSFWIQGAFLVPAMGSLEAVWIFLAVAVAIMGAAALSGFGSLAVPPRRHALVTFGSGILAVAAYIFVAIGFATGQIAIVAVLSTLSSVVTALLGYVVLRERLALRQLGGVAMILVGVVVINAA